MANPPSLLPFRPRGGGRDRSSAGPATTANSLLIVEDEPNLAALVERVAVGCGYEASVCSDVDMLARKVSELRPTHIILDLLMPGTDGIQALRELAASRSKSKILIVSGLTGRIVESARRFGIESGLSVVGALSKPLGVAELRAVLERIKNEPGWLSLSTLRQAIDRGELFLEYQPRVNVPSRTVSGVEALVRWAHPDRGTVMPCDFLPVAESSALIDQLTSHVFEIALAQLASWRRSGLECQVSINLSARNVRDLDLADRLASRCQQLDIPPACVALELTESAAMEEGPRALDILTRLRLKGFELAIDDFGTGYSSLVQLHRLPFGELKIDRTFVTECDTAREANVIVRTIIDLAHNLGLHACAEGVETEAVVRTLEEAGCDLVQGYHIARPMAADQVVSWASRQRVARPVPAEKERQAR
jgi:EAL domain-containing protein (putative c-di-GMP-specific phosphodiesterase class I)/ActR/RegA family two-component response regulator